ncbi:acetyl-coenzyme A synthetase N-terminal domain-containing protein, partial [Saccharopolyspora thermophila]
MSIEAWDRAGSGFAPPEEFAAQANASAELYEEAAADREAFWAKQAEQLHWDTRWSQVL